MRAGTAVPYCRQTSPTASPNHLLSRNRNLLRLAGLERDLFLAVDKDGQRMIVELGIERSNGQRYFVDIAFPDRFNLRVFCLGHVLVPIDRRAEPNTSLVFSN